MRIFSHISPDPIHCSGQALTAPQQSREQFFVINSIPPQRGEFDATGVAVCAGFVEKFLDHARRIGLYSYLVKDYNPSAPNLSTWDKNPMEKRDPFIEGLNIILAKRPDIKPAPLAKAAGMDDSTLRKVLAGTINSMTVEKAARLAKVLGYDLSTIVALGEHSHGPEIVDLAAAIHAAPADVRDDLDGYLHVKLSQASATNEKAPDRSEAKEP